MKNRGIFARVTEAVTCRLTARSPTFIKALLPHSRHFPSLAKTVAANGPKFAGDAPRPKPHLKPHTTARHLSIANKTSRSVSGDVKYDQPQKSTVSTRTRTLSADDRRQAAPRSATRLVVPLTVNSQPGACSLAASAHLSAHQRKS